MIKNTYLCRKCGHEWKQRLDWATRDDEQRELHWVRAHFDEYLKVRKRFESAPRIKVMYRTGLPKDVPRFFDRYCKREED